MRHELIGRIPSQKKGGRIGGSEAVRVGLTPEIVSVNWGWREKILFVQTMETECLTEWVQNRPQVRKLGGGREWDI